MTLPFATEVEPPDETGEVTDDAVQLGLVAIFNGLCLIIHAQAARGLLSSVELDALHDAMATPLDDPDHRDDPTVVGFRETLDEVLARSQMLVRAGLRIDP